VGEIVERVKDGRVRLRVIDRVGAFFKTAHGEWVSPGRVEAVLEVGGGQWRVGSQMRMYGCDAMWNGEMTSSEPVTHALLRRIACRN